MPTLGSDSPESEDAEAGAVRSPVAIRSVLDVSAFRSSKVADAVQSTSGWPPDPRIETLVDRERREACGTVMPARSGERQTHTRGAPFSGLDCGCHVRRELQKLEPVLAELFGKVDQRPLASGTRRNLRAHPSWRGKSTVKRNFSGHPEFEGDSKHAP